MPSDSVRLRWRVPSNRAQVAASARFEASCFQSSLACWRREELDQRLSCLYLFAAGHDSRHIQREVLDFRRIFFGICTNGYIENDKASLGNPNVRYWQILLTQKMPFIGIVSGELGASGNPTLVATSSAFVGISASVPQGRPPFLGDHNRRYRGLRRAAAQGQTPSRYLHRTQAAERCSQRKQFASW
jgi:hypothetical protein